MIPLYKADLNETAEDFVESVYQQYRCINMSAICQYGKTYFRIYPSMTKRDIANAYFKSKDNQISD